MNKLLKLTSIFMKQAQDPMLNRHNLVEQTVGETLGRLVPTGVDFKVYLTNESGRQDVGGTNVIIDLVNRTQIPQNITNTVIMQETEKALNAKWPSVFTVDTVI